MKQGALSRLAFILALVDSATAATTTTTTFGVEDPPPTIPPIRPLGADDDVTLKLSCVALFQQHDIPSVTGVMSLAKLSEKENWDELTGVAECVAAFGEKGEVLSGVHVRELLTPVWDWDTRGTTAETPESRLVTLHKLGVLSHVKAWDAVTNEDSLEPFQNICLKTLNHWATFKPEVLSKYIAMQGVYSELPRPTEVSRRTLRRLLDSSLFRSADNLNWNIFDSNVMSYLASKSSDLGGKFVESLLQVISGMKDPLLLAVLALRTEAFLKLLLTEHDSYESATLENIVINLIKCRTRIQKRTDLPLIHSILAHWSPEMNEILSQVQTNLDASLVTLVTSCLLCDQNNSLPRPSFSDFYQLVESTADLPPNFDKNSWYVDFLLLHPVDATELEKYQHLLSPVFSSSLGDLILYVENRKDEFSMSLTPPTMALKLCSTMMRSNVKGVTDCICAIEKCFQGKKHLRRSVLHAMNGKPDVAPICYALVKNVQDMYAIAVVTHNSKQKPTWKVEKHDMINGFDREETIAYVTANPDEFANSQMMIKASQMIDQDGPSRGLLNQFLKEIGAELTIPLSATNGLFRRFSWPVGEHAGMLAGLFLGKAVQKHLYASFALDPAFYDLLRHLDDDEKTDEYYEKTYADQISEFLNTKLMQGFKRQDFYTSDMDLPSVADLSFSTLGKPSNLCDMKDSVSIDLSEYNFDTIRTELFAKYHAKIRDGFRRFVRNFSFYLNKTFRVANIRYLREISVLPAMFNAPVLTAEDIIGAINFTKVPNPLVDSFYPKRQIHLHDCIRTFIKSLTTAQMAKLLTIWTGSSSIVLKPKCLAIYVTSEPVKSSRINLFRWDSSEQILDQTVRSPAISMQVESELQTGGVASLDDWEAPTVNQESLETRGGVASLGGVNESSVEQPDFEMDSQETSNATPETVDSMATEQRTPYKSNIRVVGETQNNDADYVIHAGEEFCQLITNIAALQHELLGLDPQEVFDPQLLVHDVFSTYPVATCSSLITVVPQHSYNVARAMVVVTNLPCSDFMDYTETPQPAQNQAATHNDVSNSDGDGDSGDDDEDEGDGDGGGEREANY